jgi:mRNA-degrading endonuclease RelE of RelBE toxin-antitoxin system
VAALGEMRANPFTGDVVRLQGKDNIWRRRVGSYRIIFEIDIKGLTVDVLDVQRRTSTTY